MNEPDDSLSGPSPRVGAGRVDDPSPDTEMTWDDDGSVADETGQAGADGEFWDTEPEPGESDMRRRVDSSLRSLIEWVAVAIGALAVALVIKAFLLQAFYIPSASMRDTLEINDRVLVNKLSYSIGDVERGDIIVFDKPPNAGGDIAEFIKRVIALPGETISFVEGNVYINGQLLVEPYIHDVPTVRGPGVIASDGCTNTPAPDQCTLADGWLFVMGDNRANSSDSRVFGPIEEDTIVGRAFLKVWPLGDIGFL